jgi:hypothetical protein
MEIAQFSEMTQNVIEGTPFEEYIPTLCLPEQNKVMALEGIPEEEESNLRQISLDWAVECANDEEEFLVAFRDGPEHFRIIRRFQGALSEALFPAYKQNQK